MIYDQWPGQHPQFLQSLIPKVLVVMVRVAVSLWSIGLPLPKTFFCFFGKIMHFEKLLFSRYWVFESLVDIPRSKGRWKQTLKLSHFQRRRRLRSFGIAFFVRFVWIQLPRRIYDDLHAFFLFFVWSQGEFRFVFLLQPNQNSWFTRLTGRCFCNCFFWIF